MSSILEPLAHAAKGSDVDSTGELLHKVRELNKRMKRDEVEDIPIREQEKRKEREGKKSERGEKRFMRNFKMERISKLRGMKVR